MELWASIEHSLGTYLNYSGIKKPLKIQMKSIIIHPAVFSEVKNLLLKFASLKNIVKYQQEINIPHESLFD